MGFFKREQPQSPVNKHENFVRPTVMAKLKMGQANDKFEKEADATADQVVKKTSGSEAVQKQESEEADVQRQEMGSGGAQKENEKEAPIQKMDEEEVQQKSIASGISSVQKKDLEEESNPVQKMEEEEAVQSKEANLQRQEAESEQEAPVQLMEEEEAVQSKEVTNTAKPKSSPSLESKLNATKGNGQKLEGKAKQDMESGFGADFSNVNIHTDAKAAEMSDQIGAQAFTHGNDVYFNTGKYNPETPKGKHLLAHELTHTIQQSKSKGFTIDMSPDPLQSDVSGLHFVSNPANYEDTAIAKLPKGTELTIVNKNASASYNSRLKDKSLEWWQVKIVNSSNKSLKGKIGHVMKRYLHGVDGNTVYYKGENSGTIFPSEINCLGHACEQKSTVAIFGSIEKTLKGLGYNCQPVQNGKSASAPHIKNGKEVMMVYLYMFKSSWRDDPKDQGLSYTQLAKKYGWTSDAWKQDSNVLFDSAGNSLPTDYHALRYNESTKKWEWVGHNKKKNAGGGYGLDSKTSDAAASDPDKYWSTPDQLLTKILCWK